MYRDFKTRSELLLTLIPRPYSPVIESPVHEGDEIENVTDDQLFSQLDNVLEGLGDFIVPDDVEEVDPVECGEDYFSLPPPVSSPLLPARVSQGDSPPQQLSGSSNATDLGGPASLPIPLTTPRRGRTTKMKRQVIPKKKTKLMNLTWKWTKKGTFQNAVDIPEEQTARLLSPAISSEDLDSPLKFFQQFLDEEVLHLIQEQSNIYLTAKAGGVAQSFITRQEIFDFIRIELYMGVIQAPAYTDYWAARTRCDAIANTMPLKRYEFIRRHLHFVNNATADESDRYNKIRDLFDKIRQRFSKIPNTQRQSVDEMMVPYKGFKGGSRKQYCPKKPSKWGFKIFARCGNDGFVYDMLFYDGDRTFDGVELNEIEEGLGFGGKVVVSLCKSIPEPQYLYALHFDNWFTSLPLMVYLRKYLGILSLGTIRENRSQADDELPSEKELRKKGRGAIAHTFDKKNKVAITKWYDNKQVMIATTYVPSEESTIQRWCRKKKQRIVLPVPRVILEYNKFMGGVDLADMLVALYRTAYRSHKYYLSIFSHLLDLCVTNSWILYRRHVKFENEKREAENKLMDDSDKKLKPLKQMRLKEFRLDIADSLLFIERTAPPGRPSKDARKKKQSPQSFNFKPTNTTRYDGRCHFPSVGSRRRCSKCSRHTFFHCIKCQKSLCLVRDRNCFLDFHTKED